MFDCVGDWVCEWSIVLLSSRVCVIVLDRCLLFKCGCIWICNCWPSGLGVWYSLWVRVVPGSNPGWAHTFPIYTLPFTTFTHIHTCTNTNTNTHLINHSLTQPFTHTLSHSARPPPTICYAVFHRLVDQHSDNSLLTSHMTESICNRDIPYIVLTDGLFEHSCDGQSPVKYHYTSVTAALHTSEK